ncbi:NAD(P)/FAD-dependent oxidoreductase [Streptomyces tibetensis]|uniref:NAD(P)/FAD-dependent oxidoreductase n=1 Tax=Streptomyces tibetensis TaxID=2382123 RepID=UPI0033E6DE81
MNTTTDHDVIVLGAGIAGSMLGAILARHGASVLLVDAGSHPKFAVGESTIPETLVTLRMIAERYDVPEIATLTNTKFLMEEINTSFGVKDHFGFLLHREGEEPDWREAVQLSTPGGVYKTSHLFRQDTDTHLFHAAVRHGCVPKLDYPVSDVEIEDDSVAVVGSDGRRITARYLVDASGFRSPLAAKLGLREEPSRLKHHSRSLFSHMINVRADEVLGHTGDQCPPTRWYDGTMHHTFERGWFWVIPFDNNPASRNPLVSVGVTLDERMYPKNRDLTPEQEFFELASRFPAVKRQFENAVSVREWVSTERLQYSATRSVGARWCLMSHAAGFIDPLFSRGISNTANVVNVLAHRLLGALREDDFTLERFAYVERVEQGLLDYNDALVNASFISFDHYPLWSAVFRVWTLGTVFSSNRLQAAMMRFRRTGDPEHLRALEDNEYPGLWWPDARYRELLDAVVEQTSRYERGEVSGDEAARHLFGRLASADFVPKPFGFADIEHRFLRPTPRRMVSMLKWAVTEAPDDVRDLYLGPVKESLKGLVAGRRPA